jgi:hypothetical protein
LEQFLEDMDLRSGWKDPMEANDQDLEACDYRRETAGGRLDRHKEDMAWAYKEDDKVGTRRREEADTLLDGAKREVTFHVVAGRLLLLLLRHWEAEGSIHEVEDMANMDTADAAAYVYFQQMAADSSALALQFQILTAQQSPSRLPLFSFRRQCLCFPCH